jgi:beta-mannosidase
VPDTLERFVLASQLCQAEAKKFFVESFRAAKWRRTGVIWWNLLDGGPQFSDAVVDYYFRKKLAFHYLQASQAPVYLMLREPAEWRQELVGVNDTRRPRRVRYSLKDLDTGETLLTGRAELPANGLAVLGSVPHSHGVRRFYVIAWQGPGIAGRNHHLAGHPPFDLDACAAWVSRFGHRLPTLTQT